MTDSSLQPKGEDTLFRRFKTSVISYGLRQIVVIVLTFASNIILTHYLLPGQFGQVAVITIVITIATLLADGGLGVYLIQRHAEVSANDLSRVTTLQLSVALGITLLIFLGAVLTDLFIVSGSLGYMIAVAALSLPFQVVRGMALLVLERSLYFNKIVRVELLEQVAYILTAILLASQGAGAWSIAIAFVCKSTVGALSATLVSRFRFLIVKPSWDDDLKSGLKFGLHFQAGPLITMARVSIIPLYIVPMFGYEAAGFVERALFFSSAPLGILAAIQNRTMFPYVSRIQYEHAMIRQFTEDSIYISAIIDKIMFLPLVLFARPVVEIIFNIHWLPMLPLMYWILAGNVIFGALAGSLYPVASGIGKPEYVARLNFAGLILSWVLTVPLTLQFGISGVGIAALIMWSGIVWLKYKIEDIIGSFRYFRQNIKPLIAFSVSGLVIVLLLLTDVVSIRSISGLILWGGISIVLYAFILLFLDRKRLLKIYRSMSDGGYGLQGPVIES